MKTEKLLKKYSERKELQNLLKNHKKYLDGLKKKKLKILEKEKLEVLNKKKKTLRSISLLEKDNKIKLTNFSTDENFIKNIDKVKWYQLIKKIKRRFVPHVLVVIHRPDNIDVGRFFPLVRNHMIKVGNENYLFNPSHFRYMNGQPVLYFYQDNPFAKIVNVNEGYVEPTISAEALESILTSKFVKDAVTGEDPSLKIIWFIILIVLSVILLLINIVSIMGINNISKTLGG